MGVTSERRIGEERSACQAVTAPSGALAIAFPVGAKSACSGSTKGDETTLDGNDEGEAL